MSINNRYAAALKKQEMREDNMDTKGMGKVTGSLKNMLVSIGTDLLVDSDDV
jgi:hypothetical protein